MTPILVLGFNVIILIYRINDKKKTLKENDTNTFNVLQVSYGPLDSIFYMNIYFKLYVDKTILTSTFLNPMNWCVG